MYLTYRASGLAVLTIIYGWLAEGEGEYSPRLM
jgi:hypothetical protein